MTFLVLIMWLLFLAFSFTPSSSEKSYNLTDSINLVKQDCKSQCGDLIVPYPFGIVGDNTPANCSINEGFDIYCNESVNPPKASFTKTSYTSIINISDTNLRTTNIVTRRCSSLNGSSQEFYTWANYTKMPYTFSNVNKFMLIGCDGYSWLTSATKSKNMSTGCMVFCSTPDEVGGDECSGNGCCQSPIPQDINYYRIRVHNLINDTTDDALPFAPCTYAFVGEENSFKFKGVNDLIATNRHDPFFDDLESRVPRVLDWAIGNLSCTQANKTDDFACQSNSTCVDSGREAGGYRCECNQGYQGNPYLSPGCYDIDECKDERTFCDGICANTAGNYTCKCKEGYSGDGKVEDGCRRTRFNMLHLYLGLGLGFLTILIGLLVLRLMVKQRKLIKLREEFFEQNGGLLLENKLKTTVNHFMKIFQVEELEDATDNYAEHNILGRGGNGTVYKGTLPDKRIVAIKKSQRMDQEQRDQFINEMVILAQINHRNVVQLLGCCLETDVPMLAYEFVSNDTLYRHIHNRTSGEGRLSWDSRLRIAHESAGALAYLHNQARTSIIHRDVKLTNILLDDNYIAKMADFGASRFVPLGHDQVTTLVQGTIGYLDPEYFHKGKLTDKSDVYSFGVVLAELLTGKKPIERAIGSEDMNLATYFLKAKMENRLHEILDRQVVKEANDEELKAACDLVCRCLNQTGGNRPSMKEVAMELETLRKSSKLHPWSGVDNYPAETSSFMIESEEQDLYTVPLVD